MAGTQNRIYASWKLNFCCFFLGDLMIIGDVDETHHIHHIPMDPYSLVCSFKETTVGFYVSLSAESKSKLL